MGRAVLNGFDAEVSQPVEDLARADFISRVSEMLKTDDEFREYLDVDGNPKTYQVVGNKVMTEDNRPVTDVIKAGLRKSTQVARFDPAMEDLVERDTGDLGNALEVEKLAPGMSRFVVSMDPKRALELHRDKYRDIGFREGIAYIQWYCKVDAQTLVAGALSVDMSDEETWRQVFAGLGVVVPEDVSSNGWVAHAIERLANPEEALAFAKEIRRAYYLRRGATQARQSIDEYVHIQKELVDHFFDVYYPPLSRAVASGRQDGDVLQGLARSVLQNQASVDRLKPELRRQLIQVANTSTFNDDAGRTIDGLICYALAEELRKGLGQRINATRAGGRIMNLSPGREFTATQLYNMPIAVLNELLARDVHEGVRNHRAYGGCGGEVNPGKDEHSNKDHANKLDSTSPQDVFGGRGGNSGAEGQVCVYDTQGCYCCSFNDDGTPRPIKKTVRIRVGEDGFARCQRDGCQAWIAPDGDSFIGHIAEKAETLPV
jgi:hypothetical protein